MGLRALFYRSRGCRGAGGCVRVASRGGEAKLLLREIYYRQREFRQETGHYTDNLDSLGVGHRLMRNFMWPPGLEVTQYQFEAWAEEVVDLHEDGQINRWVIRQDSKTWKVVAPLPRGPAE